MATLQGSGVPKLKVESVDQTIKPEPMDEDDSPPYMDVDDEDGYEEDIGDLDFSRVQQPLWLGHVSRSLWAALDEFKDDAEIEIGTIRIEGAENNPSRVCLESYITDSITNHNVSPCRSAYYLTDFLSSKKNPKNISSQPLPWRRFGLDAPASPWFSLKKTFLVLSRETLEGLERSTRMGHRSRVAPIFTTATNANYGRRKTKVVLYHMRDARYPNRRLSQAR